MLWRIFFVDRPDIVRWFERISEKIIGLGIRGNGQVIQGVELGWIDLTGSRFRIEVVQDVLESGEPVAQLVTINLRRSAGLIFPGPFAKRNHTVAVFVFFVELLDRLIVPFLCILVHLDMPVRVSIKFFKRS